MGLAAGSYTVVAQDGNGCQLSYTSNPVTITPPTAVTLTMPYESCPGVDGHTTLKFLASGGAGSYQYRQGLGTLGSNTFSVANGATGLQFQAQDGSSCQSNVYTYVPTNSNPTALASSTTTATSCSCNGENRDVYIANGANAVVIINDKGNNLGTVSATVYQHGSPVSITGTHGGQVYAHQRNWVVNATTQPVTNISLKFPFTTAEFNSLKTAANSNTSHVDDINTIADIKATRYVGPTEDGTYSTADATLLLLLPQASNGTIPNMGNPYVEVSTSGTSEYWLHAEANVGALPVTLVSFSAEAIDNKYVRTEWVTASEIDDKGFDVERSTDGADFESIGWVQGAGNSNSIIHYSYDDQKADYNTTYYYRLKQTDIDGATAYSNIVSAALISGNNFIMQELHPNPANTNVNVGVISPADGSSRVAIIDVLGRKIIDQEWKLSAGLNNLSLDLTGFAAGTYDVILYADGIRGSKKLVIMK
jgi:hypothetical protein